MKQEELRPLVQQLRQGDTSVKATIIANHMRLAMSIVSKYAGRYPYIVDDMVGATMMGICQAVEWASTRLYDNNIPPYIYQT
jgi:DNA-directed RNA polymerase specialized sigma subunit